MDSVDNPVRSVLSAACAQTDEGDAEERGPTSPETEQDGARGDDEEAGGAGERDSVHVAEKMEMEAPEETEMAAAVGTTGVSASTRFMPMTTRMDSINPFHLMQHGLFLLLYLYTTYDSGLSRSGQNGHAKAHAAHAAIACCSTACAAAAACSAAMTACGSTSARPTCRRARSSRIAALYSSPPPSTARPMARTSRPCFRLAAAT